VYANSVADGDVANFMANFCHGAGDFVPQRYRQIVDLGNASAIMRVGVTDPSPSHANQNIGRTDHRSWNVRIQQRLSDLDESDSAY